MSIIQSKYLVKYIVVAVVLTWNKMQLRYNRRYLQFVIMYM